jgi:hypothetical protein
VFFAGFSAPELTEGLSSEPKLSAGPLYFTLIEQSQWLIYPQILWMSLWTQSPIARRSAAGRRLVRNLSIEPGRSRGNKEMRCATRIAYVEIIESIARQDQGVMENALLSQGRAADLDATSGSC